MPGARRTRPGLRPLLALLAGLGVLAGGAVVACGTDDGGAAAPATTTTVPVTEAPTATTAAPTTTTLPLPPVLGPTEATRPGDGGLQVLALQHRLYDLGYFLPAVSGTYDAGTTHAVMAFQKLHGLARDGVAGPATIAALATATKVAPAHGLGAHLEVSLAHQVLIVVDGRGGAVAVDATSGAPATPTPPGTFSVFRQVDGWDPGPNGALYRPKYFNRGIAVHGGPPVVAQPASHGCIRVPDPAIDWLWQAGLAPIGVQVVVT